MSSLPERTINLQSFVTIRVGVEVSFDIQSFDQALVTPLVISSLCHHARLKRQQTEKNAKLFLCEDWQQ